MQGIRGSGYGSGATAATGTAPVPVAAKRQGAWGRYAEAIFEDKAHLGLRARVMLSRALRHDPPVPIVRRLGLPVVETPPAHDLHGAGDPSAAAGLTDRKQASSVLLEPAWPVSEARLRAHRFLAQRGIGDAAAVPQAQCYATCRTLLLEAAGTLADENLSYVSEALARQLGRAGGAKLLQDKLLCAVVDRAGSGRLRDPQVVELVSGVLRAFSDDPGAADAAFRGMARRAFAGTFSAFERQARQPGREGSRYDPAKLYRALAALAIAAGGSRMGAARFQALTGVIDDMLPRAGTGAHYPIRSEDLALVLRMACQEAGGRDMPAELRELALAQVCSPSRAYSSGLRGTMVYQLGVALRLSAQPPELQRALLAGIAGARLDNKAIGTMAWALGLHLVGDPVKQGWHKTDGHIVHDSAAPGGSVITALFELSDAGTLPRLERGLMAVVPDAALEAAAAMEVAATLAGSVPAPLPLPSFAPAGD